MKGACSGNGIWSSSTVYGTCCVIILVSACFHVSTGLAQIGGKNSFEFLNVPPASRLSGLGGINVSLADRDVNFFYSNPALTSDSLGRIASVNYQFYVADIGLAAFTYATPIGKLGFISFGVQHMGYGSVQGYDQSGMETGTFNSGETALLISKNHRIGNFRMGATMKGIISSIAGYRASAMAFDIGGVFIHPRKQLTVGLTIKNIGFVFSDYSATSSSRLPADVQAGVTFKPEHMPLRFSISAFNLITPDATYFDQSIEKEKPGTFQRILSHVNIGAEILIHRKVNLLAGYNYLNHRALKLSQGGGSAGVSFGFSAQIKSLEFVVSRSAYVAGNAGYSFTLSTNINNILKRQQKI